MAKLNLGRVKGDKGDPGILPEDLKNFMKSTYGSTPHGDPITDANTFKTDGVAMTSKTTAGLPEHISIGKREGTIMFIRESQDGSAGIQIYFPHNRIFMGKIFTRIVDNGHNEDWIEIGAPDTHHRNLDANLFKDNGWRRTDNQTQNIPVEVKDTTKAFGMIFYISDNDNDVLISERGRQIYIPLGEQDPEGKVWTRKLNNNIWTEWIYYITSSDLKNQCFLKKDWEVTESQAHEDQHVLENGFIVYPAGVGGHKMAMEWFKVDIPAGAGVEIRTKKVNKIVNAQVTQWVPSDQHPPRDTYNMFTVRIPDGVPGNLHVYSSDRGTSHAYVTVIGLLQ